MKRNSLQLVLVYQMLTLSFQYDQRCPIMKEKDYMSKVKCKEYHCLAKDSNGPNIYKEECRERKWVSAGNYPIIRGRYIDYESCPIDSYQPKRDWSNERYKCIFLKSLCSEVGQRRCDTGNTINDSTCWCDASRGYHFITLPNNTCFCSPIQEDCSCYLRQKINQGFKPKEAQCKNDDQVYDKCKLTRQSSSSSELTISKDTLTSSNTTNNKRTSGLLLPSVKIEITILIGITLAFLLPIIVVYILSETEKIEKESLPAKTSSTEDSRKSSKLSAENTIQSAIEEKSRSFQKETPTTNTALPTKQESAFVDKMSDEHQKIESTKETTKKAISIVHVEENTVNVSLFKKTLIKSLKLSDDSVDINDPGLLNREKEVTMDDLLNYSEFIFLFLSRDFTMENLKKKGYDCGDILENRNHFKVIKVDGFASDRKVKDQFRIDLSYYNNTNFNHDVQVLWGKLYSQSLEVLS